MKVGSLLLPVLGVLTLAVILTQPFLLGSAAPIGGRQVGALVLNELKNDVSPPVRDMETALTVEVGSDGEESGETEPRHPWHSQSSPANQADSVLQQSATQRVATAAGLNFDGQTAGAWPVPDSNGAVGATQFVQWVNVGFSVYDKTTGARIKGPVSGNALWKGFGGPCQTTNSGDPIAQYDKAAGRWVMTQHATPKGGGTFYQCVAVSTTPDATGTFFRYAFPMAGYFPDYPKLGIWPDAYYLSIDLLQPVSYDFVAPLVCALDRNSMLNGAPATAQCFQLSSNYSSLLPSDLDGSTPPPSGSPNYFVNLGTNSLDLWQFHADFSNPSNSSVTGPAKIAVAAFTEACKGGVCVPQLGTGQRLDSLGDRLMYRLAYRNFGDHESLVVNHSVAAGSTAGVRWYEIQSPGNNPFVLQQGTYAPDANYRWMGSVAMDKVGDIAVGYSVSSSSMYPSIRYTGRVSTDPLGTLEGEASIVDGTGSQTNVGRWGDYTALTVDPVDDCTFWYTNQYLATNGKNWRTRIASFKFTTCQ